MDNEYWAIEEQRFDILTEISPNAEKELRLIEQAGRTCYKTVEYLLAFMADEESDNKEETEETNDGGVSSDLKELDSLYPYPPLEDLVKERNELRTKYSAIDRYINCIADPDKIAYSEMKILEKQREVIGEYISILDTRLKKAGVKND